MKILLVGNYDPKHEKSMQRFASMLEKGLLARGHQVRLVRPPTVIGSIPAPHGLKKWLGYADKFLLFPRSLRRTAKWADLVHICDQGNSMYVKYIADCPLSITCHDVLAIRSALGEIPDNRTSWTGRKLQGMILKGLKTIRHVACVSDTTRLEVLRVAGLDGENVRTISNGLNYPYAPLEPTEARKRIAKLGIEPQQRFILHVGGNAWYKNRLGLLRIFHSLKARPEAEDLRLVMAGAPLLKKARTFIREHGLDREVLVLLNPNNEGLRALYSSAEFLLFPSLQEGFGWPIIEAQACGCPVVTSGRSPMTEVGGGTATYIDPCDIESSVSTIVALIGNCPKPCQRGMLNAERFSPESMIAEYDAWFRTIVNAGVADGRTKRTDRSQYALAR